MTRRGVFGDLLVQITELGVPVGMLLAFQDLGVALQTESQIGEHPGHRSVTDLMPELGQRIGQVPRRLRRPDQQRHRVPASLRLHESPELQQQSRIRLRQALPAATGCPHPDRRLRLARQLTNPTGDGVRVHAGSGRDDLDPTPAELPRLGPQKQSTLPLIQMGPQHHISPGDRVHRLRSIRHTTNLVLQG